MSRNVIITGGSGDIGRAIASRFAREKARIGLVDLAGEALDAASAGIENAVGLVADVTDEAAVDAALDAFGATPDVVVCNAGIGRFGPLEEMAADDFAAVLNVNLFGAFLCARAAAKRMLPEGRGSIITVTSINAITPGPGAGAYPAAKAGLATLTTQMALEWAPRGLRVNAIAPGFIDAGLSSPFFKDQSIRSMREKAVPSRRLGLAEDIAEAAYFLASDAASYINGHQLVVDGGVSPSLLTQLPRSTS